MHAANVNSEQSGAIVDLSKEFLFELYWNRINWQKNPDYLQINRTVYLF